VDVDGRLHAGPARRGAIVVKRGLSITDDSIRVYSRRGNFHSEPDQAAAAGMHGLVAQGTQVCAPAIALLLDAWGEELLAHGELDLRFVGMVLGGHDVEAEVDIAPDGAPHGAPDGTASFTVANLTTGMPAARGTARRRAAH
jgi:acyl dehydratase